MNIFKSSRFSFAKKGAGADQKFSAPATGPILNRLRLQPNNLGSDRLRLRNTALLTYPNIPYVPPPKKKKMSWCVYSTFQ